MTRELQRNPSTSAPSLPRLNCAAFPSRFHGRLDFAALRRQIAIGQVLDLIGWEPVSKYGVQLRGPCPIHKSQNPKSRSLSVNLEKHAFRCFRCSAKGNALDLWTAVTGARLYDAALDLCRGLGIEPPVKK
jgi:DNA primase